MNNSIITIYKKRIDKGNGSIFYETISSLYYSDSVEESLEFLLTKGYVIKSVTIDGTTTNIPLKTDFDFMRNTYSYLFSVDEIELVKLGIIKALTLDCDFIYSIKDTDMIGQCADHNFIDMIDMQSILHDKLIYIIDRIKIKIDARKNYNSFTYFNDMKEDYQSVELHNNILDQILNDNDYLHSNINCYTGTSYGYNIIEAIKNYCEIQIPAAKVYIDLLNENIKRIESLYSRIDKYTEEDLIKLGIVKEEN